MGGAGGEEQGVSGRGVELVSGRGWWRGANPCRGE